MYWQGPMVSVLSAADVLLLLAICGAFFALCLYVIYRVVTTPLPSSPTVTAPPRELPNDPAPR